MRAGREQADRDPAADVRRLRLGPTDCGGGLLDVSDEIGVERLGAVAQLFAGQAEVVAPYGQWIKTSPPCKLVDLRLADPLQMCRAERAVGARRAGVGVDAAGVDTVGMPPVGPGRGVSSGRRDAGPLSA